MNANGYTASSNNSMSNPAFVLKMSMVLFLVVQAIRQLVLVNGQYDAKTESRSGQVASWMTIVMTLIIAGLLYPSQLSTKTTMGGLALLVIGAMGSGISMIYDAMKNKTSPEKNRLWFGITHVVFAMIMLAFLLYSLTK
jgi:uncharacterized membrane protein